MEPRIQQRDLNDENTKPRGETGSPGSERPFFPNVRARALTVTPTGEPVQLQYRPVVKSKQPLARSAIRQVSIEAGIRSGAHFIDVQNLSQVITEMLDDMVNRLETRGAVHLNRKMLEQRISRDGSKNPIHFVDGRANTGEQFLFRQPPTRCEFRV